jgi:serine/threonine-protein kinase
MEHDLVGRLVDNRYVVTECIGKGGMATVYRAEQVSIKRAVALKVLSPRFAKDPQLIERFRNEAALASRLKHPNTVTVYDFGVTEKGALYIAMELIDGPTLTEELNRRTSVPWKRTCRICLQVTRSLADAASRGIVHRDLKPDNIMLDDPTIGDEHVKVLDFGIAKALCSPDDENFSADLTSPNEVFGTPDYMSPEQVSGRPIDARSDIYALGVIMYRMLCGALPFCGDSPVEVMAAHLKDTPRPFHMVNARLIVPPRLEELVMSMLAKEPEDRPKSMEDVASELEAVLAMGSRGFAGWTPRSGIPVGRVALRRPSRPPKTTWLTGPRARVTS